MDTSMPAVVSRYFMYSTAATTIGVGGTLASTPTAYTRHFVHSTTTAATMIIVDETSEVSLEVVQVIRA